MHLLLHSLILIIGVFACSTAVIMINLSREQATLLAALRLFVAVAVLSPLFIRDWRRHRGDYGWAELKAAFLPGILLGLHFISWIIGARMTPPANASLIVNLVPIVMPFFLLAVMREPLNRGETIGTAMAIMGLLILTVADFSVSPRYFAGDIVCFLSMLVFAYYLVLGRRNQRVPTTWLYVVPLYAVAGLFCFAVSLFFVNPIKAYPPRELALIAGLGCVPTVLGHSILNFAMRKMRGQVVSIVNMGQFIFAGTMAYLVFGQIPGMLYYPASVLLVVSSIIAIRATPATLAGRG